MNNNKTLAFTALAVLVLTAVPFASAQVAQNAGTFVTATDVDVGHTLANPATDFRDVCYIDQNNDGGQQPGEPVYLSRAATCVAATVGAGDVRLTSAFGNAAGTLVKGSDDDFSRALTDAGTFSFRYFDADGNGAYNLGDTAFLQFGAGTSVAINDIALNGDAPLVRIGAGSSLFNVPTSVAGAGAFVVAAATIAAPQANTFQFFDADGNGAYSTSDAVYFNQDILGGAPGVADIHITALGSNAVGSDVKAVDVDTTIVGTAGAYDSICFVDANSDGALSNGEAVYMRNAGIGAAVAAGGACGNTGQGDVRLTANAGFAAGTIVSGGDDDFSRATLATAAFANVGAEVITASVDTDGSGGYSQGDALFIDTDLSGTVTINDIDLSDHSFVGTTHNLFTNGLTGYGSLATVSFFNADALGAVVTTGDWVYQQVAAGNIAINNVRLTAAGGQAAGTQVASGHQDLVYAIAVPAAPFLEVCFVDIDADGTLDIEDPLYLISGAADCSVTATQRVVAGSVRLTAYSGFDAGTIVTGADDDFNRVLAAVDSAFAVCFFDENGNAAYESGEHVYLRPGGCGAATVNTILVTDNKFERITASHTDFNKPLATAAGFAFNVDVYTFNADGVAAANVVTTGDTLYLDVTSAGGLTQPGVGMIRLTGLAGAGGSIGGGVGGNVGGGSGTTSQTNTQTQTSTNTQTQTSTPTETQTQTQTATPTDTGSETGSETSSNGTPGFELVALVAALGAALVLVRRRL